MQIGPEILPGGEVEIENMFDFINLDRFNIHWKIIGDATELAKGVIESPDVPAQQSMNLKLPKIFKATLTVIFKCLPL